MDDLREVQAVMAKEIEKHNCSPLMFDELGFAADAYHEISSREKLDEVIRYLLRLDKIDGLMSQMIMNNVYMDEGKNKHEFHRTWTGSGRKKVFKNIQRRIKHLKPEYDGKCYVESVRCFFSMEPEALEKCRYTYEGQETYAFQLSDKYILGLFTQCEEARRSLGEGDLDIRALPVESFSDTEQQILLLKNVRNVIFQALLLDDMHMEEGRMYANLYTIYVLKQVEL
ncbi:MAG: hypothetical protein MJ116_12165 [Lachnospiraceae bacterium]|nr:hypothetical protein [Lachnospiraceae bacterium]